MFVIRKEQMKAFDDYAYRQFINDMVAYLRANYPKQVSATPEVDLRQMIETGIDKAETYGVMTVTDVERFLGYMVTLGRVFDTSPDTHWAGEILRNKDMSGTTKMDSIDDHINFSPMEKT